jgi:hypothetical protein
VVTIGNTINQKIIDPIKNTVLNSEWWQEKIIESSFSSQKIVSFSASSEWDLNLFSQEGIIAQSYSPPNILKYLYVEQEFNINSKLKITGNPGSILDIDITSGTYKVNLGEKISVYSSIKGGGLTLGVGIKKPSELPGFDYMVEKNSLSSTWRGLSHTYRKEGVDVIDDQYENVESKVITSLECNTQTIKSEGIIVLAVGTALALTGIPAIIEVLPVLGVLKEALAH